MVLKVSKISKKGSREKNEDYCDYKIINKSACCAIADGLGGHSGGEIASQIAVKAIMNSFENMTNPTEKQVLEFLQSAQEEILNCQNSTEYTTMRTTIATIVFNKNQAIYAYVGDTRIYQFRKCKIIFQTKDHSVPQALVNAGEITYDKIRFHDDRNKIIRVLGDREKFKPVVEKIEGIIPMDVFLMCTDGFWEYINENQMEYTLTQSNDSKKWIDNMEKLLLKQIKHGNDNYSAIAIFIQ